MWRRIVLAVSLLAIACQPTAQEGDTSLALETEDPRFELHLDSFRNAEEKSQPALRLRIASKPGWHMTPEAPTHLELAAPATIELDAPRQVGADAVKSGAESIEFAIAYRDRRDAGEATDAPIALDGHLKFGVCRDGNLRCEIVQRKLQIPLASR